MFHEVSVNACNDVVSLCPQGSCDEMLIVCFF